MHKLSQFLLLLPLLLISRTLFAQEEVFLDVNKKVTEEKFAYYIQKEVSDSAGFVCIEQRYNNGKLHFQGCAISLDPVSAKKHKFVGTCKWYYRSGTIKRIARFNSDGKLDGKLESYHENGNLESVVNYENGSPVDKKKEGFSDDGEKYTLFVESFKNNENDWELYNSETNEAYIEDGKLTLVSHTERGISRFINVPVKTAKFEIEATIAAPAKKDGATIRGIVFNFKDWENYHYFYVQDQFFSVGYVKNGVLRKTANLLSTIALEAEESNVLEVKNELDKCYFFINNRKVHVIKSVEYEYDKVGFVIGGEGIARFEKLQLKELDFVGNLNDVDDKLTSSGSGFIVSTQGYVVTNNHVVEDAKRVFVELPYYGKTLQAKVVITDKESDLAVLKLEDSIIAQMEKVPFGLFQGVGDVGSSVYSLGYPQALSGQGKEVKFTDGRISSKTGFDGDLYIYQTTIPIQPGSSGSPMFTEDGRLIGCMNATYRGADNVSYSIKSGYIRTILESAPDKIELPVESKLNDTPLTEQIKVLSKYMVLIKVI